MDNLECQSLLDVPQTQSLLSTFRFPGILFFTLHLIVGAPVSYGFWGHELSCLHGKHCYPLRLFLSFNSWYLTSLSLSLCIFVSLCGFETRVLTSSGWLWTNSKPALPFYAEVSHRCDPPPCSGCHIHLTVINLNGKIWTLSEQGFFFLVSLCAPVI